MLFKKEKKEISHSRSNLFNLTKGENLAGSTAGGPYGIDVHCHPCFVWRKQSDAQVPNVFLPPRCVQTRVLCGSLQPTMTRSSQDAVLQRFRKELVADNILHQGDSIGTDDETLLLACTFHLYLCNPAHWLLVFSYRRFLRARKFDLAQSKTMFAACQHWRRTVENIGIDQLYRDIDPFDVCLRVLCPWLSHLPLVSRSRDRFWLLANVVSQGVCVSSGLKSQCWMSFQTDKVAGNHPFQELTSNKLNRKADLSTSRYLGKWTWQSSTRGVRHNDIGRPSSSMQNVSVVSKRLFCFKLTSRPLLASTGSPSSCYACGR